MYKLLRPILFKIEPETMHNAVAALGQILSPLSRTMSVPFEYEHPSLETEVFEIKFKNPVGLAPGYDKSGGFARFMAALGFGFIEIGSVTPEPQSGNPQPRLFRLDQDEAIINRMGFNSIGTKAVSENLKKLQNRNFAIGINLGKNKTTPNEQALNDYAVGFRELGPLVDYVVVNVSSPNTPGLRELQGKEQLSALLTELQNDNRETKPLLLKISPDLTEQQLEDIAAIALETKIDGIIATNTRATQEMGGGGLSGQPIKDQATRVISFLYKKLEGRLPIIGVGGIFSAADAYEKIKAGASLVEIYTGMIYEGPWLVKKIKQGLVRLLAADGFTTIKEAVGANHR